SKGTCPTLCALPQQRTTSAVDFHTEMKEDSDIAFHFQVYFGNRVVMNSREFRIWKEEVESKNMPFQDYQVSHPGASSYYNFNHRIPVSSVKMVQVWRDVALTKFNVSN
uniref:Galectin n=1 Tax=Cercocebus atys TaxID=9531 RepID=A0A2K5KT51_CERAT